MNSGSPSLHGFCLMGARFLTAEGSNPAENTRLPDDGAGNEPRAFAAHSRWDGRGLSCCSKTGMGRPQTGSGKRAQEREESAPEEPNYTIKLFPSGFYNP